MNHVVQYLSHNSMKNVFNLFRGIVRKYFRFIHKLRVSAVRHWKRSLIILAVIIVIIFGYRLTNKQPQGIISTNAVTKTLVTTFSANGQVKAGKAADLKFLIPSKVAWIGVGIGDQVVKGQIVASLDQRELVLALKKSLLKYQTDRWDFETTRNDTYKDLALNDIIKREKEKSQFGLDNSVIDVEIRDLALKNSQLVSPIKGTVIETNDLVSGMNLTGADSENKFIRIVDLDSLYFDSKIDEVDYAKVHVGQQVSVVLDAFPETVCRGKVTFIYREGKETTGGVITIPVEVKFTECPLDLATGLNGQAEFETKSVENALVIPKKYLVMQNNRQFVWIQTGQSENDRLLKPVTVGDSTATEVQITSGLYDGQTVLLIPSN